jgi:hypothetical protein
MTIRQLIHNIPWSQVRDQLYGAGFSSLGKLLDQDTCDTISGWYDNDNLFRSRIEMARYRFGKGECLVNFANFDLPSASLNGLLTRAAGQINGTNTLPHNVYRVGVGTGVYSLGATRQIEFGLRLCSRSSN